MATKFKLDSSEVFVTRCYWTRSSGRRRARGSRALDTSDLSYELTHEPTGIKVRGEIVSGNYSRKEMAKLKDDLHKELLARLEKEVANFLRIAGRS